MAVGIESKPAPEAGVAADLVVGRPPDEINQPPVDLIPPAHDLGERQCPPLFGHPGVERVDPAKFLGIPRRPPAGQNGRQMRQGLLFPPGHVRDDVSALTYLNCDTNSLSYSQNIPRH